MNFKVNVFLGKVTKGEYYLENIAHTYQVGSDEQHEIHLLGDRIAKNHAKIIYQQDRWKIVALDGELKVAGESVKEHKIAKATSVSVGPYLIKFSLLDEVLTTKVKNYSRTKASENRQSQNESSKKLSLSNIFAGLSEKIALDKKSKPSINLDIGTPYLFLAGFIVVAWIYMGIQYFSGPEKKANENAAVSGQSQTDNLAQTQAQVAAKPRDTPQTDNSQSQANDKVSLSDQRVAQRYLQWADQLIEQNEEIQAFVRLQAGHEKIPEHYGLKQRMDEVRLLLVDKYQQNQQFDNALKLLEPVKADAMVFTEKYSELLAQNEQYQSTLEKIELIEQQMDEIQSQFSQLLEAHQYQDLRSQLQALDQQLINADQGLKANYTAWMDEIAKHEIEHQKILNDERMALIKKQKESRQYFMDCIALTRDKNYAQAYKTCQMAKSDSISGSEESELALWLDYLQEKYQQNLRDLVDAAEECYQHNDMHCAFNNWQQVLEFDPSQTEVEARQRQITEQQVEKASELYKTAKAYEDLGYNDKAIESLETLFITLPLPEQPLYKKAQALKNYLDKG